MDLIRHQDLDYVKAKTIFLTHKGSILTAIEQFIRSEGFSQHPVNDELRGRTFLGARGAIEVAFETLVVLLEKGEVSQHQAPLASVFSSPSVLDIMWDASGGEVDEALINTLVCRYLDY